MMARAEQQSSHTSATPAAVVSQAAVASVASSQPVHLLSASASTAPVSLSVQVSPNQPAPTTTASPATPAIAPLTLDELKPIVNEAIAEWAKAGVSSTTLDALSKVKFSITDLPGSYLGWTTNDQVSIDSDAAGYGWFVDPTPSQSEEFQPTKINGQLTAVDSRTLDRMDLLTEV